MVMSRVAVGALLLLALAVRARADGEVTADQRDAALTKAGVPHEFHRYDGAGHGFQDFHNPDRYRETQAEDAWKKLTAFLDRTL